MHSERAWPGHGDLSAGSFTERDAPPAPGGRDSTRSSSAPALAQAGCDRPTSRSPWLVAPRPAQPSGGVRLFCLPYAGGGPAAFRDLSGRLSPQVEVLPVQLPGRAGRIREKPLGNLLSLSETLADVLDPLLDRPYALLGHSLGALVAFETARELMRRGSPSPARLFVSSRRGPRLREAGEAIHSLPDDRFTAEVDRRYGGIPEQVRREPELMKLLLPSLRGDFEMLGTYEYFERELLDCPLVALRGRDDSKAPPDEVETWSHETRGAFSVHEFPGGHFFFQQTEEAVAALLLREIEAAVSPSR